MEVEQKMIDENEPKKNVKHETEEVKEILGMVSKEVPALIKNILSSVFSEEAGRDMGKAAAAFYKELKEAGMPEETAVRMTEGYMSTFTSLGDMLRNVGTRKGEAKSGGIGKEVSRRVEERVKEKLQEEEEEDED
jgi:hypothetical protein